jgi:predicted nucleotidyltransferase
MKKVVSFRLEEPMLEAVRERARARNQGITGYIESVVTDDLARQPSTPSNAGRPTLVRMLRALRDHRSELEELGVRHAGIFGSVSRGEDRPGSDADIVIEIDPSRIRDLFDYSRVCRRIEALLGRPVDVTRRDRARREVAAEIERDGILAF